MHPANPLDGVEVRLCSIAFEPPERRHFPLEVTTPSPLHEECGQKSLQDEKLSKAGSSKAAIKRESMSRE
jgi:hypothetical protein